MSATVAALALALVALLLLVYIGGAVSIYDQPPLWTAEPYAPPPPDSSWYPASLIDQYDQRRAVRDEYARQVRRRPVMGQNRQLVGV